MPDGKMISAIGRDAINLANAMYVKQTEKINATMDTIRKNQTSSISSTAKAAFAIGSAYMTGAILDAAMNIGSAAGNLSGVNDIKKAEQLGEEKTLKVDKQVKEKDQLIEGKQKEIKALSSDKENDQKKQDLTDEKAKMQSQKERLNEKKQRAQTKASQEIQKAMSKAQMLSNASQGICQIPKGTQDMLKAEAESIKTVSDQSASVQHSSYEKAMKILDGFIQVNYLQGLVALGSIQLR